MTCIAGIVHQGIVFIAGDSAGSTSYQITTRRDPKVFRNGAAVMGCTGSFRLTQLLRYSLKLPAYASGDDLMRYMTIDFINAVRTCLREGGFAEKEKEKEHGGTFLVGIAGRLFYVEGDYQVGESDDDSYAIGTGDDIAFGALFATRHLGLSPQERLELALQAAQYHIKSVRGPFIIESTTSLHEH
jgi:ATP-dependent protease HslVU (ClpYQ) peptidase subunit